MLIRELQDHELVQLADLANQRLAGRLIDVKSGPGGAWRPMAANKTIHGAWDDGWAMRTHPVADYIQIVVPRRLLRRNEVQAP